MVLWNVSGLDKGSGSNTRRVEFDVKPDGEKNGEGASNHCKVSETLGGEGGRRGTRTPESENAHGRVRTLLGRPKLS